ncbi:MAG: EamA family transporter [Candidatus Margulisiibacteriota bacterium]|nr:EamA family transporter [Candidatus Margulisiibacteriota bacterium]
MNYLILAISIALAVLGQLLMKHGMNIFGTFPISKLPQNIIPMFMNPWVFCGMAAFAVSSIFWLVVLSRINISFAYPMVSVAYVIVALFAMIFFKENVTLIRWLGIAVICFGVFLISRS